MIENKFWNTGDCEITPSHIVKKLNQLFKESIKLIQDFPQIGKPTDDSNTRIKVVRDYLIFYEETASNINILTIWDSRQDPDKLKI